MKRLSQVFQTDMNTSKITDIDFSMFPENIKGILLDTDGTYTHLGSNYVIPEYCSWIQETGKRYPLLSITCNHERKNLDDLIPLIGHRPVQRQMIEHPKSFFRRAAKMIDCEPNQVAVINDSLIMLGLFVRPLGCFTVKVNTINYKTEHTLVGYAYHLGQWIEKKIILHH